MKPHFSRHHRHPILSKVPIFVLKLVEGTRMHPKNRKFLDIFKFMRSSESTGSKESVLNGNADARTLRAVTSPDHQLTDVISELLIEEFFFRSCDFARLLVIEFCQQSTWGLESNQSRVGKAFSSPLKMRMSRLVRRCLRSSYAQCRHP